MPVQPGSGKKGTTGVDPLKRRRFYFTSSRKTRGVGFFLALVSLWVGGCSTLPAHYVPILPAPVTSFPPVKPGLVRLPVDIVFPSGGDFLQHLSNLFKGGLQQLVPDISRAPGLDVKSHVASLWATIEAPIFLDKDLWLVIHPRTLAIGMMRTDLKRIATLHSVLEMTANPEIIFGPKPLAGPTAMPPLGRFRPGPGTFRAMSNVRISYKEANDYFRDPRLKIIGMVLPGTGGQKVTLDGIRLYGSGGKVIVEVKLHYNPLIVNLGTKPAKLTIYLRGTPRFLPQKRMFDMPDLDYDIKSSDLMVQVADWLFKSDFRNQLRKIAVLPIGPKVDLIKAKVNKALNRPLDRFASLQTQVNYLRILDGFADNEGIEVRVAIRGTATLEVTWN